MKSLWNTVDSAIFPWLGKPYSFIVASDNDDCICSLNPLREAVNSTHLPLRKYTQGLLHGSLSEFKITIAGEFLLVSSSQHTRPCTLWQERKCSQPTSFRGRSQNKHSCHTLTCNYSAHVSCGNEGCRDLFNPWASLGESPFETWKWLCSK